MLNNLIIRNDTLGSGEYGASRNGHSHEGVDYVVTPSELIKAPEKGRLIRKAIPYANDTKWEGFVFQGNSGYEYKVFYAKPLVHLIGKVVEKDTILGYAQDISKKYSHKMKPHIHVETRINNVEVNPESVLKSSKSNSTGIFGLLIVAITGAIIGIINYDR